MTLTAAPPSRAGSLPLVGGDLALDFCNTTSGRGTALRIEHLDAPETVIAWARHAAAVDADQVDVLGRRLAADQALGVDLMRRAHRLREVIHDLGASIAARLESPHDRLDALAEAHAACVGRGRIVTRESNFGWSWDAKETPAEAVLGPIIVSALALLTQADLSRLKQCRGQACGWLFLDGTKNRSRRWCEMEVCGNRAKQKRHQDRRGQAAGPPRDESGPPPSRPPHSR